MKKTAAIRAAALRRLTTVTSVASKARVGLYNTAGFACGTASAWVTWGVGAGLAGAGASFVLMGILSESEKGAAR